MIRCHSRSPACFHTCCVRSCHLLFLLFLVGFFVRKFPNESPVLSCCLIWASCAPYFPVSKPAIYPTLLPSRAFFSVLIFYLCRCSAFVKSSHCFISLHCSVKNTFLLFSPLLFPFYLFVHHISLILYSPY